MLEFGHISKFKRINICGCPGAGKSTLAKKIAASTGYSFYDLDDYLYNVGCKRKSIEESSKAVEALISNDSFIIDGTYFTSFAQRMKYVDLVILVESGTISSLFNFFKRLMVKKHLKCGERITLKTFKLLLTFNSTTRSKIIKVARLKGVTILAYNKSKDTFSCLN